MKVGDLVRHRFDGAYDEVGLVMGITARQRLSKAALVSVMWSFSSEWGIHTRDYRMRDLEVVNETKH